MNVQLAAYTQALTQLQAALRCDATEAVTRIASALGCNPSLEDLHRAYVRVVQGGAL